MTETNIADPSRFGWSGNGTNYLSVGVEAPLTGHAQLVFAWNDDQWAILGSGAINAIIPSLIQDIENGVFNNGTAGITAWELWESLKTIKTVQSERYGWTALTQLSGGKVNGYVEDLQGTVYNIGFQAGPYGGVNVLIPNDFNGSFLEWYNRTPGAGWEMVASNGIRLNSFIETTTILYQAGPTKSALEELALSRGVSSLPIAEPPEFWQSIIAPCFSAGTPILLADGTSRAIEDIHPGDAVAAFDETDSLGRADLCPATVARLLPGVTEEWIVLEDTSSARLRQDTRVTPGHRYLTEHGTLMAAADLITSDIRAVAADGSLVPLRGTLLRASDAGSDAEWITPEPFADAGNLVQPAPVFGWRTYNFEVAELHTYVAANDNDQQEPDKRAA